MQLRYQVRGWRPWHRFVTLAMLALALLTILTVDTAPLADPDPTRYAQQPGPIALTTSEIRRLFNILIVTPHPRPGPPTALVKLAPPPPNRRPARALPPQTRHIDREVSLP
jgi:hypothetical protein